jgi:hypothetical protein
MMYSSGYGSSQAGGGSGSGNEGSVNQLYSVRPTGALNALDSLGVPNEGGQISWPLGLRILAPEEQGGVRQHIEALFQLKTNQAEAADTRIADELGQSLAKLRTLLLRDRERMGLPQAVNRESEIFVQKLKAASKA